ncbi:hypothetical protein PV327_007495 [Microctonus hyperodae]|uniref:IkappaB kinase n=1 Tax=Microctonus hyperodae TaxID=165561 RepID=A0AA39FZA8_MICHY|nr:hypothetical protein PV327_007495 [Microctonus hyperodae]
MAEFLNNDTEQWVFVKVLGAGAFGIVELWQNESTIKKIAIKRCRINVEKLAPKQIKRWNHEVMIMNSLNHPNIVATHEIPKQFVQNGNNLPVLCMEYCNKGDLRSVLNKCENICGVQKQDAFTIMYDISSAVEYIHNHKITHRDLKPSNIVMQQTNNRVVYKLIDLGYAKELGDGSVSASIVGTLNYLAPELLWKETYSCSVDYWSLGILFYEIITGIRPFLPNMQLCKTWMNHIQGKQYEHISAREINGQVQFFNDFEETTYWPDCLKSNLVEWFRIVFQWDPTKRGKTNDGQLVVFTMLKEIFNKKIICIFIVSHFKIKSYDVNLYITVGQLKLMIQERENIIQNHQIITDSTGKILSDEEKFTDKMLQDNLIIVFDNEKLCSENIPKLKISQTIQEMIKQPRGEFDYYTLRKYYGATIFFMKNQIELYQNYILALSIIIDMSNDKFESLSKNINKLVTDKECLVSELKSTSKLIDKCTTDKHVEDFTKLSQKINQFFDGMKQMMEKFNTLNNNNEELRSFSDINWMNEISAPYDKALDLLKEWNAENHVQPDKPCAMVKLIFEFLANWDKQLSSSQFVETRRKIVTLQKKLVQLENVLTSFMELLKFYRQDIVSLREKFLEECKPIETTLNNCNDIANILTGSIIKSSNSSTIVGDDSVIYESIVISNMLGGLITEMDLWKRKLAALSNFDA